MEADSYYQRVWLYVQSQGVAVDQYELPEDDPRSTAGLYAGVDTTYQWIDWDEALSTLNVPEEDFETLIEENLTDELPIRRERDQNFIPSDDHIEKYMQIRRGNVRQNNRDESPLSWETLFDGVRELFDVSSDTILQATKQRRLNRLRRGLLTPLGVTITNRLRILPIN